MRQSQQKQLDKKRNSSFIFELKNLLALSLLVCLSSTVLAQVTTVRPCNAYKRILSCSTPDPTGPNPGPDVPLSANDVSGPRSLCVGEVGTYSICAVDRDQCGDPQIVYDGVHAQWTFTGGTVTGGSVPYTIANTYCRHNYAGTINCSWSSAGTKTVTVTLSDDALNGGTTHDSNVTVTFTVNVTAPSYTLTFLAPSGTVGNCATIRVQEDSCCNSCATPSLKEQEITSLHPTNWNDLGNPTVESSTTTGKCTTTIYDWVWSTTSVHNGQHKLHCESVGCPGAAPVEQTVTVTNLDITNVTPNVVAWTGNQATVPITVSITDNDTSKPMDVTLELYDTSAAWTFGVYPLRTMTLSGVTGGSQTFNWDGKDDGGNLVSPGTYTYEVSVFQNDNCSDYATYRSYNLEVQPNIYDVEYAYGDPVNHTQAFRVKYHISSDKAASFGEIDVYDPLVNNVYQTTIPGSGLTPGDHQVDVVVPESDLVNRGTYQFVISTKDDHAAQDRAHRIRWAYSPSEDYLTPQVYLTDPIDTPSPMLFRGKPNPCPVVIKGYATNSSGAQPRIIYTYEWIYPDGDVQAETAIPSGQLSNQTLQFDNSTHQWNFSATWNQQLKRTLVFPWTGDSRAPQNYIVRAYAIDADSNPQERHFTVLTMAKPANAVYSWLFGQRNDPPFPLTALTSDGQHQITINYPSTSDFHLGVDIAAGAGAAVNAAEYGSYQDFPYAGKSSSAFASSVADQIWQYAVQWMNSNGHGNDNPFNPWNYLQLVVASHTGIDSSGNLGTHAVVDHGMVNITLTDANASPPQYDQSDVSTAYGHLQLLSPPPGSTVDISQQIATVAPYDRSDSYSLGYFALTGVILRLETFNNVTVQDFPVSILYFPGATGSHNHFEVRVQDKINTLSFQNEFINHFGEVDPIPWLGLGFGQHQ